MAMRILLVILLGMAPIAIAQMAPVLHARAGEPAAAAQPATADATYFEKGFSTLPDDASGEYVLNEDGSVVQVTIEHDRLSGYVTKMENGSALTLFFQRTSIHGNQITFMTKTVHGLAYSFTGEVVRGDKAQAASETGFFRLAGEWTEHRDAGAETARVSLKSTPR